MNKVSDEERMATVFTLTSPFLEPAAIGLTDGIKGGFASLPLQMKTWSGNTCVARSRLVGRVRAEWAARLRNIHRLDRHPCQRFIAAKQG